jgi:hypothetical protein
MLAIQSYFPKKSGEYLYVKDGQVFLRYLG